MRILIVGLVIVLSVSACKEPGSLAEFADPPPSASSSKAAPASFEGAAPAASASKTAIRSGAPVSGSLGSGDTTLDDGRYYDSFAFDGAPGMSVTVSVASGGFDTYLFLSDDGGLSETDDDGGDDTNSMTTVVMAGYTLTVRVTSYDPGETGSYELLVEGSSSLPRVNRNETVTGRLEDLDETFSDGRFYDAWSYTGTAGERVTIDLASGAFDTLVSLRTDVPGAGSTLVEDDDSGDGLDSRIENYVLPSAGTYVIVVGSYAAASGDYTLAVRSSGGGGTTPVRTGGDPNGKYALLVGIGDYPGTGSDLASSPVDIAKMRDVLIGNLGFEEGNVVILRDDQATRAGIMNAFRSHLGQAGPDGIALFYYTGHGTRVGENMGLQPPVDPEEDGQDEALYVWGDGGMSSIILDDELGFLSDQLLAERTLILIDACFSGTGTRAPGALAKALDWADIASKVAVPTEFDGTDAWNDIVADSSTIMLDDMRFMDRQLRSLSKGQFTFGVDLWPNGVVPFAFAPEVTQDVRDLFMQAVAQWEAGTDVDFVDYTSQANYLRVSFLPPEDSLAAGSSYVGVVGGAQDYLLNPRAQVGTMLHELGHALGLMHEQTRMDRDLYVAVLEDNIVPRYVNNFSKLGGNPCGDYNFASVMHYPPYAFSATGEPTLVPRPQYQSFANVMGTRALTPGDLRAVNMMYTNQCEASPEQPGLVAFEGEPVQHVLISASDNDSEAWTSSSLPGQDRMMSVFTYYITEALRTSPPSRTLDDIAQEVSTQTDGHNRQISVPEQTPGIEGARKRSTLGYFLGLDGS